MISHSKKRASKVLAILIIALAFIAWGAICYHYGQIDALNEAINKIQPPPTTYPY